MNTATVIGRAGQDAEIRYFESGKVKTTFGGWDTTVYKRGFEDMIEHFLNCVKEGKKPNPSIEDSIISHKLCEYIVNHINNKIK